MREFKFKVWDTIEKKWYSDFQTEFLPLFSAQDGVLKFRNGPVIIQQFTGLLDKNGREVYEGDIIETCFGNVCVKYFCGSTFCEYRCQDKNGYHTHKLDEFTMFPVIGNIFENPELLNG